MQRRAIAACEACASDVTGTVSDADEAAQLAVAACVAAVRVTPWPTMTVSDALALAWGPLPSVAEVELGEETGVRAAGPIIEALDAAAVRLARERDDAAEIATRLRDELRERDERIAILEAHAEHDARAIAQNVVDLQDLRALTQRLTAKRDAARAIINGRATAPTDAEIAAHAHPLRSPIGAWLVTANDGCRQLVHLWRPFDGDSRSEDWEMLRRRMGPFKFTIARWVPINAEGCPCAWPVVEGER
jgi:hypothetical protein